MWLAILFGLTPALNPPRGLDLYRLVPEDNLLTREKVTLGRRLFFDKTPGFRRDRGALPDDGRQRNLALRHQIGVLKRSAR